MFLGHFGLAFAAKRAAPGVSLAALFTAGQLADVLWPFLLIAGVEQVRIDPGNTAVTPLDFVSYPISHSLLLLCLWGAVFGLVGARIVRGRWVAVTLAALVVSHWVLDVVVHRPDVPVYPGGPRLGLGLWNSVPGTIAMELLLFGAGVWVYARETRARDGVGRWAFAALVVFLLLVYAGNLIGGPPPSVAILAWSAIAGSFLLLLWAWWTDRHRARRIVEPHV
jgi:hypothetical protein